MPKEIPPQHQDKQPGIEQEMNPRPVYDNDQPGFGRLKDKVAIITGGDSGIGRSVAVLFAKEGADVAIVYLNEHEDAEETAALVRKYGKEALLIPTDISVEVNCKNAVDQTVEKFGRLDILVNNAAVQYEQHDIQDISAQQWEYTFRVNIFSYFFLSKYASAYIQEGGSIINTTSVNAYRGNEVLMDYSATKGAIVSFTRSLSQSLIKKGVRVNAVAPGPVWTPLIPASFDDEKVEKFGKDTPMQRPAQPVEIATCYVFLASNEAAFLTGQVLHPNGGSIINT
ncbi:SDR family oxidoreductase [Fulvivirgaceae bacterium PWU20]|uniref:SDR family oxidoreductase n=2 Tax=Chryseosolibacter indicus TaxID=2782351 RepID=A0ABS5VKF6_9BACT|nr:SDR family oxidoreductase [Chryseosolibacter indicus]